MLITMMESFWITASVVALMQVVSVPEMFWAGAWGVCTLIPQPNAKNVAVTRWIYPDYSQRVV